MGALGPTGAAVVAAPAGLERVACNLCGAWDAKLLYAGTLEHRPGPLDTQQLFACTSSAYGRYGPVERCERCGLVYLNPRLTTAAVESAYEEVVDARYLEEREGRVHTFMRALDGVEALARGRSGGASGLAHLAEARGLTPETNGRRQTSPNGISWGELDRGRLLDVGCHIGVFLELAVARGWAAEGVEPSWWASEQARGRGLRVTRGTLRGSGLASAAYDVVTLWDVIEHFPDPAAELREVHRLLRPGGLVGITTMDVDSLVARVLGPRWPWLMEMHLYYFSVRTLSALLKRCGFRVLGVAPHRRVVRVSYLLSRLERWAPAAARALVACARRAGLADRLVPVDLGDIFTLYGQRADSPNGRYSPNGAAARLVG